MGPTHLPSTCMTACRWRLGHAPDECAFQAGSSADVVSAVAIGTPASTDSRGTTPCKASAALGCYACDTRTSPCSVFRRCRRRALGNGGPTAPSTHALLSAGWPVARRKPATLDSSASSFDAAQASFPRPPPSSAGPLSMTSRPAGGQALQPRVPGRGGHLNGLAASFLSPEPNSEDLATGAGCCCSSASRDCLDAPSVDVPRVVPGSSTSSRTPCTFACLLDAVQLDALQRACQRQRPHRAHPQGWQDRAGLGPLYGNAQPAAHGRPSPTTATATTTATVTTTSANATSTTNNNTIADRAAPAAAVPSSRALTLGPLLGGGGVPPAPCTPRMAATATYHSSRTAGLNQGDGGGGIPCRAASSPLRKWGCDRATSRPGRAARRGPELTLLLLLAAVVQGITPAPCAGAGMAWTWLRRGSSTGAAAPAGASVARPGPRTEADPPGAASSRPAPVVAVEEPVYSGPLPFGWRKYVPSSRSSKRSGSGGAAGSLTMDDRLCGGGGDCANVTFRAGRIPVDVNPAVNDVEGLLSYKLGGSPTTTTASANGTSSAAGEPSDAQLAVRELLLSKRLPFDPMMPYKLPPASYNQSDFVYATVSFPRRYLLAQSTRAWRRGIRAFIAINNTEDIEVLNEKNKAYGEHYEYFPDDGKGDLGPLFHGQMAGDTRAAMTPFLAHEYFGETYKWMLYGDDDTIFYMPGVKRLLPHLDPELPYAISDNLWFRARHPNLFAPRCLPCHFGVDADPPDPPPGVPPRVVTIPNVSAAMDGYLRFLLGVRKPSDLEKPSVKDLLTKRTFRDYNLALALLDNLSTTATVPGVRYVPRPACPFCTSAAACNPPPPPNISAVIPGAGCSASGGHGGAGMIFSIGLLRRLASSRMKACFLRLIGAPGGDSMLSYCLWQAGYAFTDPGPSVLSVYDGNFVMFSSEAAKWALHDPVAALLRGKCDGRCKWTIRNAASHHGRGRHYQTFQQSAAYLYANMAAHAAVYKWTAFVAARDVDMKELAALVSEEEAKVRVPVETH